MSRALELLDEIEDAVRGEWSTAFVGCEKDDCSDWRCRTQKALRALRSLLESTKSPTHTDLMVTPESLDAYLGSEVVRSDQPWEEMVERGAVWLEERAMVGSLELGRDHMRGLLRTIGLPASIEKEPTFACGRCGAAGEFYEPWQVCEDCWPVVSKYYLPEKESS